MWSPVESSVLKFNVDGVARGKPGLVGIGGFFTMIKGRCFACSLNE